LRARTEHDKPVNPSTWDSKFSKKAEWAHGEIQERFPSDTVLKFFESDSSGLQGGFALERDGRIVAEHTTALCKNDPVKTVEIHGSKNK